MVEDDSAAARLLEIELTHELGAAAITVVATLADALVALGTPGWAVCVLDLGLPDSQGLATLRAVRDHAVGVPVVVLSGDDREETTIEALRLGAEDYLNKNTAPGALIARKVGHIMARQTLTAELRASRDGLQAVLDSAADGIVTISERGIVLSFNAAAEGIFGWTAEEVIGRNVSMLMPADIARRHDGFLQRYTDGGEPRIVGIGREVTGQRKDGTTFPLHLAVGDVALQGRRIFTGVVSDLTDLKAAERRAEERGRLVEAILNGTPDPIFSKDGDGRYLLVNEACSKVFGLSADSIIGQRDDDLLHSEIADAIRAADQRVLAGEGVVTVEEELPTAAGPRIFAVTKGPLIGADGTVEGLIGVARDITELRNAQSAVVEAGALLRLSIGALKDAFVLYDPAGNMVVCNRAYEELLGADLQPGVPFDTVLRAGIASGLFREAQGREEDWLEGRMRIFREGGTHEMRVGSRWYLVTDVPLPSGHVVGTRVDITALRDAREAAEAANRAKSEFLSSMSHELRTPLNAILGFAQLMEVSRKDPLTDRQRGYLQHICTGGAHLLNLINDVLDLARIESGGISLSIEPVDTRALLEDCLTTARSLADPQDIAVVDTTEGLDLPWLSVDLTRAKQVLLNLLSNAVKYNRQGGTVTLSAEVGEGVLKVLVTDTGAGIPADRQAELFVPFSRLGKEHSEIEGTGIGLTITRRLVEDMGGAIGFSSVVGEGSTFWVELPLGTQSGGGAVEGRATQASGVGCGDHVVLYVEDNPANRILMEEIIDEADGFTLICAETAELGLEMARAAPPDVVLMDINLPGMDGFDALDALRADPLTRHIPVVALSADAMPATVQRGEKAGFVAYLTKPVKLHDLLETLELAVSGRAPQ